MRCLTVIPARGGSTRVPHKNRKRLGARSLVQIAVDAAADAGLASGGNMIAISSDDEQLRGCHNLATGIERPPELAGPRADISAAVAHALAEAEKLARGGFDQVLTLQPTLPVRPPDLIPQMLRAKQRYGALAALTVMPCVPWTWRIDRDGAAANEWHPGPYPRSQDITHTWAQEYNCVTIADRVVVATGCRWGLPLLLCELPRWAWIDIDTAEDLDEAKEWYPVLAHRRMGDLKTHLITRIDRIAFEPVAAAMPTAARG